VLLADLAALAVRSHRLVGHARRYRAGLTVKSGSPSERRDGYPNNAARRGGLFLLLYDA
jgi:hypothetical protein